MSRFFQRRGDPVRGELDELVKVLSCLKSSNVQTRFAVGAGVYLANTDFIRRFGGMDAFRRIPLVDQDRFYSALSDLEQSLRNYGLGMALGVGLYRIWLVEVLAGRRKAADLLGEVLTELSRKASSARPLAGRE
ncbi:MAG: hypothetical protein ABSD29_19665 [Verrucomicrobiota bacterium]|jgi:hypothetical protein